MAATLEETTVTYEELADIEREFDDVETEIIRQQVTLTKPLYEKREKIIAQIPNFWPLVFEQAPPDIDEYIQPSDAALFLSALKSLSVSHFEIEAGGKGDPRSLAIRFEFNENDHFEDAVLEKKFWYRRHRDGWAGLVSEPVDIQWKEGKDLTGGLLRAVKENWAAEQQNGAPARGAAPTETQKKLEEKIESTGLGGGSFFLFFGFIGRRVSAEENRFATEKDAEYAALRKAGKAVPEEDDEDDEDDDDYEDELSREVCPDGDDLAVTIAEDLWPAAIKYFTQAQEMDELSDADFESDEEMGEGDDDDEDGDEAGGDLPPSKKRKS